MDRVRHICTCVTVIAMLCLNVLAFMPLPVSAEDDPEVSGSVTVSDETVPDEETGVYEEEETSDAPDEEIIALSGEYETETYASVGLSGQGTSGSPYLISSLDDFNAFASAVGGGTSFENEYIRLTASIDLGYESRTPIGNSSKYFSGSFDGGGHTISGLSIKTSNDYIGLFGYVGSNSTIKNLTVSGAVVLGGSYVGGIAAENYGTITDCNVSGNVTGRGDCTGGIAGKNGGVITGCSNSGNVKNEGNSSAGGITGENHGTVTDCHNTGKINGSIYVGGIAAENYNTVTYCHNSADVMGGSYVGGVVGYNYAQSGTAASAENCYNTGYVGGSGDYVGGIAGCNYGYNSSADVQNCYNTGHVLGSGDYTGGAVGYNYAYSSTASVQNCYNIGDVAGGGIYTGGIAGRNNSGGSTAVITDCYYLIGQAESGVGNDSGIEGVSCITAEEFADQDTFTGWFDSGEWEMSVPQIRPILANNAETNIYPLPAFESVFDEGDGTESSPFLIGSPETLKVFRDYVNSGSTGTGKYFKLTSDITISGNWTPIGIYIRNDLTNSRIFDGTFDGGGHEIKGLHIDDTGSDGQGLFGNNAGTIRNLGLAGGSVTGNTEIGGIAGYNSGTIESCYNTCSVKGMDRIGGIAGNNAGIIQKCYSTGTITSFIDGSNGSVGGITGENNGTVINCYNTGDISGNRHVGGVVGYNSIGTIENCYNIGSVDGTVNVGGVVGVCGGTAEVISCYYLEGCATSENDRGESISDVQLADMETFVDWNFHGIWIMKDPPDKRPIFGFREELSSGNTANPGDSDSSSDNNGQGAGGGAGNYPGAPGIAPAEYYKTETAKAEETESDAVLEDDDVSSAAGIYEDSRLIENAVPAIAVTILMAVSAVLIIKLRRKI